MANKRIELYEDDGQVYRRVTRDLGGGHRTVTSDTMVHPDVDEFMRQNPDATIRGVHPQTKMDVPSPHRFNVNELPPYLAKVESVDALLRMKGMDDRATAQKHYEARIKEILKGASEEEDEEAEGTDEE